MPDEKKLTWAEILARFPAAAAIAMELSEAVNKANEDGKVTATEVGTIMASLSVRVGELIDAVIADAND